MVWFKLLGEAGFRRQVLFELDLATPVDAVPTIPVVMGWLGEGDRLQYSRLDSPAGPEEVDRRLRERQECFVARTGGRVSAQFGSSSAVYPAAI